MSRWLRKAKILAMSSSYNGYKVGAVIVRGGRIISEGTNKESQGILKSKHYTNNCGVHAELKAINSAKSNLRGADIYVFAMSRCGNQTKSQPCKKCGSLIIACGIKNIIFLDWDGSIVKIKSKNIGSKEKTWRKPCQRR